MRLCLQASAPPEMLQEQISSLACGLTHRNLLGPHFERLESCLRLKSFTSDGLGTLLYEADCAETSCRAEHARPPPSFEPASWILREVGSKPYPVQGSICAVKVQPYRKPMVLNNDSPDLNDEIMLV